MELSNKLSNLRKQIDKVENEIKDNVILNQNDLFEYSNKYSNLDDYNISKTSQQLFDNIAQLKYKINKDHDDLSNDIDDLTNVESALNLLRLVYKFTTLFSILDKRIQNIEINDEDIAQIVLTIEELDRLLLNNDLNKVQVIKNYKPQLKSHKSKISAHISKSQTNHSKSNSIDQLLHSNKGFLNNVFDNLAI